MDHVMNYQEFLDIAEKLRPWTEQAMKIEVAPWIRDYVVDMDDLYSDLTLEKVENKTSSASKHEIERTTEKLFS